MLPIARSLGFNEVVTVIGSGLSKSQVAELIDYGLTVMGYQNDISIFYKTSRVAIVPLLSGAGLKGKLAEALSFGLPTITTTIGAEGFRENIDGELPFIVSDDPTVFASKIIQFSFDADFSKRFSSLAKEYVRTNLGTDVFVGKIAGVLGQE